MEEFEARIGAARKDEIDSVVIELLLEREQITRSEVTQKTKKKGRTVYNHLSDLIKESILGVVKRHGTNFYFLTNEAEEALKELRHRK